MKWKVMNSDTQSSETRLKNAYGLTVHRELHGELVAGHYARQRRKPRLGSPSVETSYYV
jgi:hypothetical protein